MTYDTEIEKLLPWYAKGLLDSDDQQKVEAYLDANPEMRMQLDLIAEEDAAIEQQHNALAPPAPGGLDRLMADIDALEAREAPVAHAVGQASKAGTGIVDYFKSLLASFSSPGMQFAGVAAALVIVAQAVFITSMMQGDPGEPGAASGGKGTFKTASGPEQTVEVKGAKFLLAFKKDAKMDDVAKLLKSQSARIVAGPKAGGFFEIVIDEAKLPEGGTKAVLDALKARKDLIGFASVSK